jgi:hypothetical protein
LDDNSKLEFVNNKFPATKEELKGVFPYVLLGKTFPHHNHEKISNTFCTNLHAISFQCKFEFHSMWGICKLELSIFYQNNESIITLFIMYFFQANFFKL